MTDWQKLDWNQMTHDERMEWLRRRVEKLGGDVRYLLEITESLTRYHDSLKEDDDSLRQSGP